MRQREREKRERRAGIKQRIDCREKLQSEREKEIHKGWEPERKGEWGQEELRERERGS